MKYFEISLGSVDIPKMPVGVIAHTDIKYVLAGIAKGLDLYQFLNHFSIVPITKKKYQEFSIKTDFVNPYHKTLSAFTEGEQGEHFGAWASVDGVETALSVANADSLRVFLAHILGVLLKIDKLESIRIEKINKIRSIYLVKEMKIPIPTRMR